MYSNLHSSIVIYIDSLMINSVKTPGLGVHTSAAYVFTCVVIGPAFIVKKDGMWARLFPASVSGVQVVRIL